MIREKENDLVKNHPLFVQCSKLISSNISCTFSFWLALDFSVHFLFFKQSDTPFNLVNGISAHLWEIKIEFLLHLCQIYGYQHRRILGNSWNWWILAHQSIQYCAVYLSSLFKLSPGIIRYQFRTLISFWCVAFQITVLPQRQLIKILLQPLFSSIAEISFEI